MIAILLILFLMGVILFISKKVCDMATKKEEAMKFANLIFSVEPKKDKKINPEEEKQWLSENTKEVEIISKDGLKLKGYERKIENKTDKWVIAVHGYLSSGYDMVQYVKKFEEEKYNSLIVDLRAHGQSEGKYIGMGWLDHFDLELWINKIVDENPNCKIALYGISMGGATVTMTTGDNIPKNVKVCIADCGYSSVWDEFKMHLKKIFHIPTFPILYIASFMTKLNCGYNFKEASSIKQVQKSCIPTLFIHGTKDKFVPYEMLDIIYKNAKCEKEKLEIEGAGHAESAHVDSEKYWKTIKEFINKYI